MTLRSWKKLSESILLKNSWWTYKRDTFQLPSGKPGEYHYVHTNGSSMIIPVLGDGTLVLVNQHRYLMGKESMEFPCGSVKEGSTHDETARHGLNEETGYSAKDLSKVGEFNPYSVQGRRQGHDDITEEVVEVLEFITETDAEPWLSKKLE